MTTPDTAEAKIRQTLQFYKEYVTGVYQGLADYDEDTAVLQLKGLLVDARLDELIKATIGLAEDGTPAKAWGYIYKRSSALQQTRQEEDR